MTNLIMPHGSNELNTLYIEDELARASMLSAAAEMRTLEISSAAAANAVMLGAGYFNPLTGYMNKEEALRVSKDMLTLDNLFWPVPIVNLTTDANSLDYTHGEEIALKDPNVDGNPVIAIQRVENVEKLSDEDI
ncbi:MAG: sulfate adenylyltransferase, partial [Gammaproteobacteria bacterium]|nr:sulfate adenylyltransferase [Gammaproteobacteria bacterium]